MSRTELLNNVQVCIQKACFARSAQEEAELLHLAKFWKRLAAQAEPGPGCESHSPLSQSDVAPPPLIETTTR